VTGIHLCNLCLGSADCPPVLRSQYVYPGFRKYRI
jgi:hypothetical protein